MREFIEVFEIQDGILKKYNGKGGHVVIPDGVTSIGGSAFRDCTSLTHITILDSVTSIGHSAFGECNVTIHTPKGSYAESYARKNRIYFVAVN